MLEYRSCLIKPVKFTQPHYNHGRFIRFGYNVVREGVNVMPGATWFHTIEAAKLAIDILIEVNGRFSWSYKDSHTDNLAHWSDEFWEKLRAQLPPSFWARAWDSEEEDFSDLIEYYSSMEDDFVK